MKNKILIGVLIAIIVAISFLSLHFQNYSITDIIADNYETKLTESTAENIFSSGIYAMMGDGQVVARKCITSADGYKIIQTKTNNGKLFTEIFNLQSHVAYTVRWDDQDCEKKNPFSLDLLVFPLSYQGINFKPSVDKLLLEKGFVLKRSELIQGNDIIIFESGNYFIIGKIFLKYDEPSGIQGIAFSMYKRNKYF